MTSRSCSLMKSKMQPSTRDSWCRRCLQAPRVHLLEHTPMKNGLDKVEILGVNPIVVQVLECLACHHAVYVALTNKLVKF